MKFENKKITSINRIYIHEKNDKIEMSDSIIFKNEIENITYQMITNQQGLIIKEINDDNYIIDGEYESYYIKEEKLVENNFIIKNIEYIKDDFGITLAFIINSSSLIYYFIRFIDEINLVSKEEFYKAINNI